MVERLARVQAAYCQLFSARGKNQKIDRTIYRGTEREKGERRRGRLASKRARKQETTDRIDTINRGHRRDLSLHWWRKLLPSFLADKKEKNCRAYHRPPHRSAPHPFESAQPALFPLYITISATCSPGNNRFTGRIRAELALYTRRG